MHVWETKQADNNLISSTFLPSVSYFFFKNQRSEEKGMLPLCVFHFSLFSAKKYFHSSNLLAVNSHTCQKREREQKGVRMSQMVEWNKAFHFYDGSRGPYQKSTHKSFLKNKNILSISSCIGTHYICMFVYITSVCIYVFVARVRHQRSVFHFLQVL